MKNLCTILVAEDDPNDAFFIQRAFTKAHSHCSIQTVGDGEEAINYLSGSGRYANRQEYPLPTLMLTDLKMPRRSGLEVLEWIRQQPALRRMLVVALTSSKENSDINRAYDLGINSYLVKPVDFGDLHETIASLKQFLLDRVEKPEIE